ncbi:unnamed protein product [Chrysoparadoxa australica]
MDTRQKRNTKTYILELLVTTPIFFALMIRAPYLLTGDLPDPLTPEGGGYAMAYSATWLVLLYTFELLFRNSTNMWQVQCQITFQLVTNILTAFYLYVLFCFPFFRLMLHHMATITTVCLALVCLLDTYTEDVSVLLILVYSAVTEQATFLALVLHRLGFRSAGTAFKVAAVTSYLFKGAVFCITWVMYARFVLPGLCDERLSANAAKWNTFWKIYVPFVNCVLLGTQVQANNVLWTLGNRMQNKKKKAAKMAVEGVEGLEGLEERNRQASFDVESPGMGSLVTSPMGAAAKAPSVSTSDIHRADTFQGFLMEEVSASLRESFRSTRGNSCHFDISVDDDDEVSLLQQEVMGTPQPMRPRSSTADGRGRIMSEYLRNQRMDSIEELPLEGSTRSNSSGQIMPAPAV